MQKSLLTPYAIELSAFIGKTIPADYPFSTQEGGSAPQPASAGEMLSKAAKAAKDQITPQDQEAMKNLLMDTLKDAKP
jgi:hypothetical protein